jgi:hypothetical protein
MIAKTFRIVEHFDEYLGLICSLKFEIMLQTKILQIKFVKNILNSRFYYNFHTITIYGQDDLDLISYPFITWLECVATTLKSNVKRSSGSAF